MEMKKKKKMGAPVHPVDPDTTNVIAKARLLLGKDNIPISRAELGRRTGYSEIAIRQMEKGDRPISRRIEVWLRDNLKIEV
jgi:hypothetical protein